MVIKKLIAISVVFALVAGAAFAVDLGGAVIGSAEVAKSVNGGDAQLFQGGLGRIRLEGSGDGEIGIGTIGGWIRVEGTSGTTFSVSAVETYSAAVTAWSAISSSYDPDTASEADKAVKKAYDDAVKALKEGGVSLNDTFQGLVWWQPIEQLKIQLGVNKDGMYDTTHLVRYGFNAQANEIGGLAARNMWNGNPASSDAAIFGGYGTSHFALIITPMEAVTVNVAIPLNEGGEAADTFKEALFQINYNADFGAVHFTYKGSKSASSAGKIYASTYLGSLVDGLGLEVGLSFTLPKGGAAKAPLSVGLGAKYDVSEQFGVKLRSFFAIPMESGGKVAMAFDLQPYYAINDSVTAYFDFGIAKGSDMTFHIAPYVRVGAEWGSSFYAGLNINNGDIWEKTAKINWGVPVGIVASF
jgi:hypothetical protein